MLDAKPSYGTGPLSAYRTRRAGISKYTNWRRALDGIYDLIGVAWLLNRKIVPVPMEKKP